jgi:hypothetical protein
MLSTVRTAGQGVRKRMATRTVAWPLRNQKLHKLHFRNVPKLPQGSTQGRPKQYFSTLYDVSELLAKAFSDPTRS